MRRTSISAVIFILSALLLGSCGGSPADKPAAKRQGIITLAPHLTETAFALGQGPRVIAVGSFCDYPPEIASLPKVGGYLDPDLERITMLSPELLIIPGKHDKVAAYAKLHHMATLSVDMDSLATIDSGIAEIGRALQCVEAANALRARIHEELESVRESVAEMPRKKVLIVTGRTDHNLNALFTANGKSFVSQVVEVAGGDNIFRDAPEVYFEASKEKVVLDAPDVILEFHAGERLTQEERAAYVADWARLPSLPAVKEGRICVILEPHALRPGPRVAEVARIIAARMHGDTNGS